MKDFSERTELLILKMLVFNMHASGRTQEEISKYVGKSKGDINALLKPLAKSKAN